MPVIELHPAAVERFIKLLSRAKAEYENYEMLKDPEKIEAMRELISHVIVSDSAANGYELDVFTYLSALTGDYAPGGLGGALVAEDRSFANSPEETVTIAVLSAGNSRKQGYKLFHPSAAASALLPAIARQRLALVG
ncbi:hypothetical protein [Brucella intermedia]|uniref:hypothetical protein n=1 Tax=Brucella intermedia TaxID=94625 RepID=UPI0012FDF2B8|nr:hypothetical protein [Brucella intermedia]